MKDGIGNICETATAVCTVMKFACLRIIDVD
jgi:hypothetical protein